MAPVFSKLTLIVAGHSVPRRWKDWTLNHCNFDGNPRGYDLRLPREDARVDWGKHVAKCMAVDKTYKRVLTVTDSCNRTIKLDKVCFLEDLLRANRLQFSISAVRGDVVLFLDIGTNRISTWSKADRAAAAALADEVIDFGLQLDGVIALVVAEILPRITFRKGGSSYRNFCRNADGFNARLNERAYLATKAGDHRLKVHKNRGVSAVPVRSMSLLSMRQARPYVYQW